MKKWIQKAIVQKTISYLPASQKINYFFQKYITKGIYLKDIYFYDRLNHARAHIKSYQEYSNNNMPNISLEIGSGWYPVVPISFFLAGTNKIYCVDVTFLTSKKRIKTTLNKFIECHELGKLKDYIKIIPERFQIIETILDNFEDYSLDQILKSLKLKYLIEDARNLTLKSNSIDFINSNNTFEHIYPDILIPILKDFKRVIRKDGVMSHFIDMSDHFAHFDKSINIYNFLKFSDTKWKWIDNSIQPQSRIRIYDYKNIYSDLKIPISRESYRKGNIKELESISLAKNYLENPLEEIAKSHCHFISNMSE
jgi:SAM-dependent methyltransferase|tara:strand:+ start:2997 stop:3926 length:930 start_codon:yes stop_codon:yes gene_type:complete